MSQFFKKRNDSFVPNLNILRQSILELRGIYSEMDDMEFCVMYQRRYGVKIPDVKKILRGANDEPMGI